MNTSFSEFIFPNEDRISAGKSAGEMRASFRRIGSVVERTLYRGELYRRLQSVRVNSCIRTVENIGILLNHIDRRTFNYVCDNPERTKNVNVILIHSQREYEYLLSGKK